jgi:hypothetical protein
MYIVLDSGFIVACDFGSSWDKGCNGAVGAVIFDLLVPSVTDSLT